ncbi:MAG: hypothetical protein RIS64_2824 [Bacteroidota bacterium]|jgi:hypothetical protein
MRPTSLKDNLNSDFMQALSRLLPKKAAKKVLVYVESYEDQSFWYGVLKQYENADLKFDIQLPSQTSNAKGKKQALERNKDMLNLELGEYLIICVDSDYDYLLQGATETSKLINENSFIFQTYAYSIENLKCFSSSLNHVCAQATHQVNDRIDFEALLKLYSNITYPLFLWSVFFKTETVNDAMNLSDFHNIIQIDGRVNIQEQGKKQLQQLSVQVSVQIEKLKTQFPTLIQKVENIEVILNQLGVHRDNIYLFIQGHAIENLVVLKFLDSVCEVLSSQQIQKIMAQSKDIVEKQKEMNHYKNATIEVRKALKTNTEFKDCFLYKWIIRDLDSYITKIKK